MFPSSFKEFFGARITELFPFYSATYTLALSEV
jgi:hypothetical protein